MAVSLIWGFFLVIFALVGVFLFGGSFYRLITISCMVYNIIECVVICYSVNSPIIAESYLMFMCFFGHDNDPPSWWGSCSDPDFAKWSPILPGVAGGTGWREHCVGTVLAFRSEDGNH